MLVVVVVVVTDTDKTMFEAAAAVIYFDVFSAEEWLVVEQLRKLPLDVPREAIQRQLVPQLAFPLHEQPVLTSINAVAVVVVAAADVAVAAVVLLMSVEGQRR